MTRKEIVMLAGIIAGLLGSLGVVVAPESIELLLAGLVLVIPVVLNFIARNEVASKETIRNKLGSEAEREIFR